MKRRIRPQRGCPPLDQLIGARAGVLADDALLTHLKTCDACAALVRDFTSSEAVELQPAERERIRRRVLDRAATTRRRRVAIPLAIAAALALVAAGLTLWSPPRRTPVEPPSSATIASMPPPIAPGPKAVQLEPAPVRLPAAMLTWRNDAEREFATDFGEAITLYRDGRYDGAATHFERITRRHPHSAEAFFYLGVSQLFLERTGEAVTNLQRAKELDRGALADLIPRYLEFADMQKNERR